MLYAATFHSKKFIYAVNPGRNDQTAILRFQPRVLIAPPPYRSPDLFLFATNLLEERLFI